jgi:hypothetical protein
MAKWDGRRMLFLSRCSLASGIPSHCSHPQLWTNQWQVWCTQRTPITANGPQGPGTVLVALSTRGRGPVPLHSAGAVAIDRGLALPGSSKDPLPADWKLRRLS